MRVLLTIILFLSQFALGKSACSLCPDGSNVTLPEKLLFSSVTCQVFDDQMRQLRDAECTTIEGMNIASYCGCEGVDPPSDPCQVCPTGQILINEDMTELDGWGDPIEGFNCAWWYDVAQHSPADDQNWCKKQLIDSMQFSSFCCGVSKQKPACSLCPDGSNVTLPEKLLYSVPGMDGVMITCQLVDDKMRQLRDFMCNPDGMSRLDIVQESMAYGMNIASYCGCEGVDPPSDPCQVCAADQVVINEDVLLPGEDGTPEKGAFTCGVWYEIAKHSPADDQHWCKDRLIVDQGWTQDRNICCGMSKTSACSLCPGGSNVTLPDKLLSSVPIEEGVMLTCQVVDDRMRQLPGGECTLNGIVGDSMAYGMNVASYCGCEGVDPPSDPCQLCPTDQILINEDVIIPVLDDDFGTPTCSMFYEFLKHSPAEDQKWCKDYLDLEPKFSSYCCGVSKSPCSVCLMVPIQLYRKSCLFRFL